MSRRTGAAAATLALLLASACASRPSLERQRYALSLPPQAGLAPARGAGVLAIPPVAVASAFDRSAFVYRTGENSYETDPYAQWLAPPRELVADVLRAHARASGLFHEVTRRSDVATLAVTVQVTEWYGDFRRREAPAARVALSVSVVRPLVPTPEPVLTKGYERSVPIAGRTAAAVAAGLDRALAGIADEVAADVAAATNAAPAGPKG